MVVEAAASSALKEGAYILISHEYVCNRWLTKFIDSRPITGREFFRIQVSNMPKV